MAIIQGAGGVPADAKTFLGHPRGLYLLFFAEMWERFSFYGMRALLILYLTKHFLLADDPAYGLYGAYTSLVYITPVIGGYVADRYLGARKAVLAGGVFIVLGHIAIALVEGPVGEQGLYLNGFYLGLALVIVGTGFLKANVSVLVGQLYPRDDPRRDPGFSIFYMGINSGAMIGPIICGVLGETVGWSFGFGAAAVGMLLGLVVFVLFRKELHGAGDPPSVPALRAPVAAGLSLEKAIYLGAIGMTVLIWGLIRSQEAVGALLLGFAALTFLYILWIAVRSLPRVERHRIFVALWLIALSPLFWALFEQQGGSLNLYTDRNVDRMLFGYEIPASVFQSVNSVFIITLAPVFAGLWTWLGKRRFEPSAPFKFGIGLILIGAGFLVMLLGAGNGAKTPMIFLILLYFFHSTAELCFSPVGLSSMTRLSLPMMTGLMMGAWFLALAAGNFIAGVLAQMSGGAAAGVEGLLTVYSRIGWFSIGVGVAALALSPFFQKLMHLESLGKPAVEEEPRFSPG